MNSIVYLVPVLGIVGLLVMLAKRGWVIKQDAGDARMQEIADAIAAGALAFLKAEWRVLIIFGAVVSVLLAYSGTLVENSDWFIGVAFLIGAFISAFAGYIGMSVATKANVRTSQAARTSLKKALEVSTFLLAQCLFKGLKVEALRASIVQVPASTLQIIQLFIQWSSVYLKFFAFANFAGNVALILSNIAA